MKWARKSGWKEEPFNSPSAQEEESLAYFEDDDREAPDWNDCACGRGRFNRSQFTSCYECFLERRSDYVTCLLCGVRWHSPVYDICFECKRGPGGAEREEAARVLRLEVLHRDDYACRNCGTHAELQVDHVRPCAWGGKADPWNLQTLCGPCNRYKAASWWESLNCPSYVDHIEMLELYFVHGRELLTTDEQQRLADEVNRYRRRIGSPPTAWPIGDTGERAQVQEIPMTVEEARR